MRCLCIFNPFWDDYLGFKRLLTLIKTWLRFAVISFSVIGEYAKWIVSARHKKKSFFFLSKISFGKNGNYPSLIVTLPTYLA
jgi:hypothetical protein